MILWIGRDSDLDKALPGIHKMLGPIPILGSDGVGHAIEVKHGDDRWTGVRYVELVDLAAPGIRDFRARFIARWHRMPTGPEALSYDAMRLVLSAVADGARTAPRCSVTWMSSVGAACLRGSRRPGGF
jgi:hypothetical protein